MSNLIPDQALKLKVKGTENQDWNVRSNTSSYNLASIVELIDKGNNDEEGGIKLQPFYQRNYKFSKEDESLLIESLLLGIPIPTIYTASNTRSNIHRFNVIDGQHRLRAVYRFLTNEFRLKGLEKEKQYNNKTFVELPNEVKNELKFQKVLVIENIHVQNNPALEWEIFKRYNKKGNPLTGQEMRSIVYACDFDTWTKQYIDAIKDKKRLKNILNISKNRYINKSIHEEFYVILGIYEYGIQKDFTASTDYAEKFMEEVSLLEYGDSQAAIAASQTTFEGFMDFLKKVFYPEVTKHPFSKEVYRTVKSRNYKCQVSILMIMTLVYKHLEQLKLDFNNENIKKMIQKSVEEGFMESQFEKTNASTTRYNILEEVTELIKNKLNSYLLE